MTKSNRNSKGDNFHWPLIIVGAGLSAGLLAYRLSQLKPAPEILIIDAEDKPFGNHTWSFHNFDLEPEDLNWIAPLIAHQWAGQSVKFQTYERRLKSPYASLTSETLTKSIAAQENITLLTSMPVASLSAQTVTLQNGKTLNGDCVIDARGFQTDPALVLGYQKFLGFEVETQRPHGLTNPIIMDASVEQKDGYRFVYVLPFSENQLLIEDTRYSDGMALNTQDMAADITKYAKSRGWEITKVIRTEEGVLPISLALDAKAYWSRKPEAIPQIGMRAGLFHPTTGYSLPEAIKVANLVADVWPIGSAALATRIRDHALRRGRKQGFYRMLNRFLFRAAIPNQRHLVMQRFYTLRQPLIERFYAGRTTKADMLRILVGKPPMPIPHAIPYISERLIWKETKT